MLIRYITRWQADNGERQIMAVFTWARITFRKTFRIAIQNVIGIVIWTTCIVNAFPITIRICALRGNILLLLRSPRGLIDPCAYAWLQRIFLKCTRTNHVPKEADHDPKHFFFLRFKMRFKSLIWNSFAFTWAKIRFSNQDRAESRSETSFGTWF